MIDMIVGHGVAIRVPLGIRMKIILTDSQHGMANLTLLELLGQSRMLPGFQQAVRIGSGASPVVFVALPSRFTPLQGIAGLGFMSAQVKMGFTSQ